MRVYMIQPIYPPLYPFISISSLKKNYDDKNWYAIFRYLHTGNTAPNHSAGWIPTSRFFVIFPIHIYQIPVHIHFIIDIIYTITYHRMSIFIKLGARHSIVRVRSVKYQRSIVDFRCDHTTFMRNLIFWYSRVS